MAHRTLIWHLGPARPPRPVIEAGLAAHSAAVTQYGAHVVASPEEARLATHELLRTHRDAGLRRSDVEGQWQRICDRIWHHKGVSLLSTPDLAAADKDQIKLALDQLIGVEVHVVLSLPSFSEQLYGGWLGELRSGRTTGWDKYVARVLAEPREHRQAEDFWAGHDVVEILSRWGWTFRPERLHVVAHPSLTRQWAEFLDLAGLGAHADVLPAVVPSYADPVGVALLRRVNQQVEQPLAGASWLLAREAEERAALPTVPTPGLEPLVRMWTESITAQGQDLRGDLEWLCEAGEGSAPPRARDQLELAAEALAEAIGENERLRTQLQELEERHERLRRKRRKLKAQLAQALSGRSIDEVDRTA